MDIIFSLRQLQEKCREQRKSLYIAFIDLTKGFDLVAGTGSSTPSWRSDVPRSLQHDQIFSWRYEGSHPIRRQHVKTFRHQKRREARLCPCSNFNPLRHPLLPPSEICFWEFNRRCGHAHKIRWQTIQRHKAKSKNQSVWDHHHKHALRRWRSSCLTHWIRSTVSYGQILSGLPSARRGPTCWAKMWTH